MYIPIELTATNFQSFEDLVYSFKEGKSFLIQGENLTDDGQKSNGSGKSTFEEIVYYCLLGSSSSGKRDFKLIRRGTNESNISFTIKNSINGSILKIERTLYLKKSSTLKILINGVDQKDKFPGVIEGNKFLLEILDISAEDLKNFYLINRDKFTPFFKYSDSDARELISRFINVKNLESIVDIVIPDEIKEIEADINLTNNGLFDVQSKILVEQTKINTNNEQIDLITNNNDLTVFNQKKKESLEKLNAELELFCSEEKLIDAKLEKENIELNEIENELKLNRRAIERFNNINYNDKIQTLSTTLETLRLTEKSYRGQIKEKEEEINSLNLEIKPLKDSLLGIIICPSCSHEFIPGEDVDVIEAKSLITETQSYIEEINVSVLAIEDKIKEEVTKEVLVINGKLSAFETKNRTKTGKVNKLLFTIKQLSLSFTQKENSIKTIKQDLSLKQTNISLKKNEISELEASGITNIKPIITEIKKQIKVSKENIVKLEEELEEYNQIKNGLLDELTKKQTWIINFKQFLIYLTNKSLQHIQELCNAFLEKIDTDLRVKIEGFKCLSDGSTKDKITIRVMRGEIEEDDYRSFSGGERGKLIFSTILAFQDLINNNSKTGGMDLLMIDEILDSVDGVGMSSFISALNKLNKTILLTTHISTEERDENVLLIKKVNNKSFIAN